MTSAPATPNLYELTGRDAELSYSSSSINGQPRLHYKDQTFAGSFVGDQIRAVQSEIGQLITVTLRPSVDTGNVTLTVLLPEITLDGPETPFQTHAVITTLHRLVVNPSLVKGPHQTYHFFGLHGMAKLVDF